MPWKTPEEEASYALDYGVDRSELTFPGQRAYDQIKAARGTNSTYEPAREFRLTPRLEHRQRPGNGFWRCSNMPIPSTPSRLTRTG